MDIKEAIKKTLIIIARALIIIGSIIGMIIAVVLALLLAFLPELALQIFFKIVGESMAWLIIGILIGLGMTIVLIYYIWLIYKK